MRIKREAERKQAIAQGLIDDPNKPRNLSEAIRFVGTCTDMCPEFEMYQREYQNNVDKWEIVMTTVEAQPSNGNRTRKQAVSINTEL